MSPRLTRRDFISDAAIAGVASALRLDASASTGHETPSERRTNFDSGWRFLLGDPDGAHLSTFYDSGWRSLDLPHDWSIEGTFDQNAPARGNGAYLPTGIGWYRKTFFLPLTAYSKCIVLQFDGVYQRSEVWINGASLGMRPSGFIGFSYNLTPHLAPPGKPNHIAVRVDNSLQPNCRWYSGSGTARLGDEWRGYSNTSAHRCLSRSMVGDYAKPLSGALHPTRTRHANRLADDYLRHPAYCLRCRSRLSTQRRTGKAEWRLHSWRRWRCRNGCA